jgi:hypothetical protein
MFGGNDYGISVCTSNLTILDDWTSCTDSIYRSDNHKLKIKFLGEYWIITNMIPPTSYYELNNSDGVVSGGSIKITRLSNNGYLLDEITLQDGQRFNLASSSDPNYKYLRTTLYWKNRNASSNSTQPDSLRQIVLWDYESFDNTKMIAGDEINFPLNNSAFRLTYNGLDLQDSDYTSLAISNNGNTELSLCDKSSGTFACSTKNGTVTGYFIKISTGMTNGLGGEGLTGTARAEVVYLDPIGIYNVNGTIGGNGTAIDTTGYSASATLVQNTTFLSGDGTNALSPTIFWRNSSDDYYKWAKVTATATLANASENVSTTNAIYFDVLGQSSLAKGQIYINVRANPTTSLNTTGFYADNPASGAVLHGDFVIQEDAGKANVTSNARVWTRIPFMNFTGTEWRFKASDDSPSYVYYGGIDLTKTGDANSTILLASAYEPTLITERGSKITGVGTTSVEFMAAKSIGMPSFTFSGSSLISDSSSVSPGFLFNSSTTPMAQTLLLYPNWNLISLGLTPHNSSFSSVFSEILADLESVWYYENDTWYFWTPSSGGAVNSITAGKSYFVKLNDSASYALTVSGNQETSTQFGLMGEPPFNINVNQGWNLLGGYISPQTTGYPNPSVNTITGNYPYSALYVYNSPTQTITVADGGTQISLGNGFWLYSQSNGWYTPRT